MATNPQQLLAEIEEIIRTAPPRDTIWADKEENFDWLGRASAAMHLWDPIRASGTFERNVLACQLVPTSAQGFRGALTMLLQAAHELRLATAGPLTVAVGHGAVFDYFDEVRKVIESASNDLFFVDRYLDADFASRYLKFPHPGVTIRLLARDLIPKLLPAVHLLRQQTGLAIEVRSSNDFHDRYLFADRASCYQSGASFKDGGRHPTTFTQLIDACAAVLAIYEQKWTAAMVHP